MGIKNPEILNYQYSAIRGIDTNVATNTESETEKLRNELAENLMRKYREAKAARETQLPAEPEEETEPEEEAED